MLARELHDTVAHHVSAIAIHAQAGRALAATSPASSVEALEVIEAEASRTLAEMRAMVRVLRNQEPAEFAPQPGVADIDRLADAGRVGPHVEVVLSGDLAGLPSPVDTALYRMAQESVTNALRHARAATGSTYASPGSGVGEPSGARRRRAHARRGTRRSAGSAWSAWPSGRRCSAAPSTPGRAPVGAGRST